MKSEIVASTLFSTLFWSMLMLSMFVAPILLARSGVETEAVAEEDLIRQHRAATSRYGAPPMPEAEPLQGQRYGACEQPQSEAALGGKAETPAAQPAPDEPVIRRVGQRTRLIQV